MVSCFFLDGFFWWFLFFFGSLVFLMVFWCFFFLVCLLPCRVFEDSGGGVVDVFVLRLRCWWANPKAVVFLGSSPSHSHSPKPGVREPGAVEFELLPRVCSPGSFCQVHR